MRTFKGIIESPTPPSIHHIWIHNGEAKYFANGKWQNLKITSEIVTDNKEENTDSLLPYVELKAGINEESKVFNLEHLKPGKFFASIGDGYGVGTWYPEVGGYVQITESAGYHSYYNITPKGIVVKEMESPDIYHHYVHAGGTKTPKQFISELINLIG